MLNFLRKFPMEWPDSLILSLPCQFQPLSVFLFWGQFLFLLQYFTRKKLANFLNFQSHPSRQPRLISFDSRRAYGHLIKLAVIQIILLRFALIINSFCMSMLLFFLYLPNPLLRTVDLFWKKQQVENSRTSAVYPYSILARFTTDYYIINFRVQDEVVCCNTLHAQVVCGSSDKKCRGKFLSWLFTIRLIF